MAKLMPDEISLVSVADISADPSHRTATTPFGALPGKGIRYVGRSVSWKRNKAAMPKSVRDGLDNAQKIANKCKGITGIGVNPLNGQTVPQRSICMLKEAGKIKK